MNRRVGLGDRRGSGTLLHVAIMVVLLAITAAVLGFAGFAVARHRAQNAADLAALAAAQTEGASAGASAGESASGTVCETARRVARANGADVSGCEVVGSPFDFVVTIRVQVGLPVHPPGLPDRVHAEANAAPVR